MRNMSVRVGPAQPKFSTLFPVRSMVGRDPLEIVIGVRVTGGEPKIGLAFYVPTRYNWLMPIKDIQQRRAYQREWRKKRRLEWFFDNGPCVDCGSWDRLELDHVDRSTKVDHTIWSWSALRRKEELEKCVPRCYKCHKVKSAKENSEIHSGVPSKMRKLSNNEVLEIRRMMKEGIPQRKIAPMFGVHRSVVAHISIGYAYAEVI